MRPSVIQQEHPRLALENLVQRIKDKQDLPDIIFLDINMPEMNGFQFLEALQPYADQFAGKCHVVMLSSSLDEEDVRKSLSFPFVRMYCNKPLSLARIDKLKELVSTGGQEAS